MTTKLPELLAAIDALPTWRYCSHGMMKVPDDEPRGYLKPKDVRAAIAAWNTRATAPAEVGDATVELNSCDCHPETCCCQPYMLRVNGRIEATGSMEGMANIARLINATRPVVSDGFVMVPVEATVTAWRKQAEQVADNDSSPYSVDWREGWAFGCTWAADQLAAAPAPRSDLG